jgi:uncharacterized membrane protein YqhA
MRSLEKRFEQGLWQLRLIVILAVVASVLLALGLFFVTSVDAAYLLGATVQYGAPSLSAEARNALRLDIIAELIEVVDGYLLAAIVFIFGLGLYELFVGKIDLAENSEVGARVLLIRSVDDLKTRLGNVVVLMLVIKFFQQALRQKYASPLDLLYLAIGVLLIGGALYLTHRRAAEH